MPSEAEQGGSLIVASDNEHARLLARGYARIMPYRGSSADRTLGKRSYYFTPVTGRAPFRQGILQTVHQTVAGVDPQSGYTVGGVMAGRIEDQRLINAVMNQIHNQSKTTENLLPVFDVSGDVVAYERAVDPAQVASLNRSTDLAKMIGVWRGRQTEERLSQDVNLALVDRLHAIWERDSKAGRKNEFVNLAKLSRDEDPVLHEAVSLIPNQTRDYIKSTFGPEEFWVRRDMMLDALGDRHASVGEIFTGNTRWKASVVKEIENIAFGIFGNKVYNNLINAEQFVQNLVANAREMIVVKSVIVPAANMISNMFQLLNRGMPLRDVLRGVPAKTAEINDFVKRRAREVSLEAELRAATAKNDLVAMRKLENVLTSIRDSYRRMSIWPLIAAGEFSAISTGQMTVEDLALADGKWTNFVERQIAKLPDGLRTSVRYGLITRDTVTHTRSGYAVAALGKAACNVVLGAESSQYASDPRRTKGELVRPSAFVSSKCPRALGRPASIRPFALWVSRSNLAGWSPCKIAAIDSQNMASHDFCGGRCQVENGRGNVDHVSERSQRHKVEKGLRHLRVVEQRLGEFGPHPSRRDCIHADSARCPFDSETARQVDESALARMV